MEYVWKCFDDEGVRKKAGNRKMTIFIIYLALFLILTIAVAVYSYAAESLTLKKAHNFCLDSILSDEYYTVRFRREGALSMLTL
jgi:hypothetical protein